MLWFFFCYAVNKIIKFTMGIKVSTYTIVEFEFDPNKSKPNREKHRIDFIEA